MDEIYNSFVQNLEKLSQSLSRYGDNLNPWGDLIAMARAWCVLKPGTKALIGKKSALVKGHAFNIILLNYPYCFLIM